MSHKGRQLRKTPRQYTGTKLTPSEAKLQKPGTFKEMLRYGRVLLEVASLGLNFWLGYLVLRPDVAVDYNAAIVPPNSYALPFKVTNRGALPVRNIVCKVTENADAASSVTMRNNQTVLPLAQDLGPGKTIEEVYSMINYINQPLNGYTEFDLWYQLPVLNTVFHEKEVFEIYRNADGTTRWLVKTSRYGSSSGR